MKNCLKKLRKVNNKTQNEVAEFLGVTSSAYSQYETGKRDPSIELLMKLAEYFKVSVDYILEREEDQPDPAWKTIDPEDFPRRDRSPLPIPDLSRETALIPILGSVRAGYDNYAEENREGWFNVDPSFKAMHAGAYVLRVCGDSMEPEIHHGDTIICLPDVEVRNNDIAIICINGDIGTVKRVRFDHDGLTLIPANPKYRSYHYSSEDVESLPVIIQAKVDEIRRKV